MLEPLAQRAIKRNITVRDSGVSEVVKLVTNPRLPLDNYFPGDSLVIDQQASVFLALSKNITEARGYGLQMKRTSSAWLLARKCKQDEG